MDIDLKTLTDSDIDILRRNILIEQERRANLESIPGQVRSMVKTYIDGGGDPDILTSTITQNGNPETDPAGGFNG